MDKNIRDIECFLLDMNGTMFSGDSLIDGAKEFLDTLVSQNKKYIFITNNLSNLTYNDKLKDLGLDYTIKEILTYDEVSHIDIICEKFNIERNSIAIVGDKLYDNMKLGIDLGLTTILVLSGQSTMYDVEMSDIEPTFVFDSIKNIYENINHALNEKAW